MQMAFQECGVSGDSDSQQHYTMVFLLFIFPALDYVKRISWGFFFLCSSVAASALRFNIDWLLKRKVSLTGNVYFSEHRALVGYETQDVCISAKASGSFGCLRMPYNFLLVTGLWDLVNFICFVHLDWRGLRTKVSGPWFGFCCMYNCHW